MLTIKEDDAHNCFVVEPSGKLGKADFEKLTATFNEKVNQSDRIPNLVIHARSFPGWKDFAAFTSHLGFLRDHHKMIDRIALVSDARILEVAPRIARHFLFADIRLFPLDGLDDALAWVGAPRTEPPHVTVMGDLPPDVIGLSVRGVISARDYSDVIIPLIEKKLEDHETVKCLYRIGPEFASFTPGAVWSDARVGLMNLSRFSKIAVVSDIDWMRHAMRVFAPLIPGEVHIFADAELAAAKEWVSQDREQTGS